MTTSKYLVFSSVGKKSCHKNFWLNDLKQKNFDLFLVNYAFNQCNYKSDCDYYLENKGTKFTNFLYALKKHPEILSQYDYFFITDDDIQINTAQINKFFNFINTHEIQLSQPSYSWLSNTYWSSNKKIPWLPFHHTALTEFGCTCFSKYALKKVSHTFNKTVSGWGVDIMWSHILKEYNILPTIINKVTCHHPFRKSEMSSVLSREMHYKEGLKYLATNNINNIPCRESLTIPQQFNKHTLKSSVARLIEKILLKFHNLHFTIGDFAQRKLS